MLKLGRYNTTHLHCQYILTAHITRQRRNLAANRNAGSGAAASKLVSILPLSLEPLGFKYDTESTLRDRFGDYDVDNTGTIDVAEAVQLLKDAGATDTSVSAAQATVDSMDPTSSGEVRWDAFKSAVDLAAEPVSSRVYPISGSLLLNFTGQGVMMPVLPVMARAAGMSASELGLVTGASALARVVTNVPAANFAERVGRKPLLVAGPAIGMLGMIGFAYAGDSFAAFIASNALAGVGGAMTSAGAGLYLSDISTPRNRARTMAPLMVTALLGFAVGPAVGGTVAEIYGNHIPFFICAAGMGAGALSAVIFLPETLKPKRVRAPVSHRPPASSAPALTGTVAGAGAGAGPGANPGSKHGAGAVDEGSGNDGDRRSDPAQITPAWQHWREMIKLPAIQGINGVTFNMGVLQGASPVTGILYATEVLDMSTGELGAMFTVCVLGMAVVVQPATTFSDKVKNRSTMLLPGLVISAGCLAVQPACTSVAAYASLQVLRSVADAAFVMPNVSPFIIDNTTEAQRGQALAMRNMGQDVGILVGATSMGVLSQLASVPTAMYTTAAMQAVTALFFWTRTRTRTRAPDA